MLCLFQFFPNGSIFEEEISSFLYHYFFHKNVKSIKINPQRFFYMRAIYY